MYAVPLLLLLTLAGAAQSACDSLFVDCALSIASAQVKRMTSTRQYGLSKDMCFNELYKHQKFNAGVYCPANFLCGLNITTDFIPDPGREVSNPTCHIFSSSEARCEAVRAAVEASDPNECAVSMTGCTMCEDFIGGYTCQCVAGFQPDDLDRVCHDVDECAASVFPCDHNARCRNVVGSYTCHCLSGYEGDGFTCADIDECSLGEPCDVGSFCSNSPGAFSCSCSPGFEEIADGSCADVDECTALPTICGDNAFCTNTVGAYFCNCSLGFQFVGSGACGGGTELACLKEGWGSCDNIDECLDPDICPDNSVCVDNPGSFSCECHPGYQGSIEFGCSNINECLLPLSEYPCPEYSVCNDLPGTYDCTCLDGFSGALCLDINECLDASTCPTGASCQNGQGFYQCACVEGYEVSSGTAERADEWNNGDMVCVDVDECETPDAVCDAGTQVCENTQGGFNCHALTGFRDNLLTGEREDVDECEEGTFDCTPGSTCVNLYGTYGCRCPAGTCPEVYENDFTDLAEPGEPCRAFDPCVDLDDPCYNPVADHEYPSFTGESTRCVTRGDDFDCYCAFGFTDIAPGQATAAPSDPSNNSPTMKMTPCYDVDECASPATNVCSVMQTCTNLVGIYTCQDITGSTAALESTSATP